MTFEVVTLSEINNEKISFSKPTAEDELAKVKALEDWTKDRLDMVAKWPFIGALAMNLDLIPVVDHRCMTASTDGRRIFFNPYFLDIILEPVVLPLAAAPSAATINLLFFFNFIFSA